MTPLERSISEFSDRSEVAPATRRYYRDSLVNIFLPWAEAEGLREPGDLIPAAIERYAHDLEERVKKGKKGGRLAVATRRAYLRAVRQYLGWLRKRRKVPHVDERQVALPQLRRKERQVLTLAEIRRLEDAAPMERDKLIVRLMADTGAREGEVANLGTSDIIDRDRRFYYVRLRGKTGERMAPIEPSLYRRLREYADGKHGRPMQTGHGAVFLSHRKRGAEGYEPLKEGGVYQVVKDTAERAGLRQRVYPHLLRHTAITHMVASGMNIVTVSEVTGVSVAVIAQNYTHQTDEQRYDAVMKALESR